MPVGAFLLPHNFLCSSLLVSALPYISLPSPLHLPCSPESTPPLSIGPAFKHSFLSYPSLLPCDPFSKTFSLSDMMIPCLLSILSFFSSLTLLHWHGCQASLCFTLLCPGTFSSYSPHNIWPLNPTSSWLSYVHFLLSALILWNVTGTIPETRLTSCITNVFFPSSVLPTA